MIESIYEPPPALRTLKTVAICSSTSYRQLSFPQRVNSVYIQQIDDLPTPSLSLYNGIRILNSAIPCSHIDDLFYIYNIY